MHRITALSFSHFGHLPVLHMNMKQRFQCLNNSALELCDLPESLSDARTESTGINIFGQLQNLLFVI